jgi:hypothetical protein
MSLMLGKHCHISRFVLLIYFFGSIYSYVIESLEKGLKLPLKSIYFHAFSRNTYDIVVNKIDIFNDR